MSSTYRALGPAAVALTVAALAAAPAASAEPRDTFLDELSTLNVWIPSANQADTVAAGYQVCDELRGGVSVLDAMTNAENRFQLPPGQGTLFVSAATTNLCPDFAAG